MAALHFTLEGFGQNPRVPANKWTMDKGFIVLRDFLQPGSSQSLDKASQDILAMVPDVSETKALRQVDFELGDLITELAEQIPYNHPSQLKLARLVETMGRSRKFLLIFRNEQGKEVSWSYMQRLTQCLRDNMDGDGGPNRDDDPLSFVNYHAFAANLFEHRITGPTSPMYAIWLMRDAFEGGVEKHDAMGYIIMGAAQYILWSGHSLFKQVMWHDTFSSEEERMFRFGPSYGGKELLGMGRWAFWKEGFREASKREDYVAECRSVAGKTADMMDALERLSSV